MVGRSGNCLQFEAGEVTELAECTGLENRRWETIRGFESLPLRHIFSLVFNN